ncbi:MAG TPA: hypothetical protein VFR97_12445 [Capillimicrobium sp.]|nr:hypothetical protein [Capillimicrobium sp.]
MRLLAVSLSVAVSLLAALPAHAARAPRGPHGLHAPRLPALQGVVSAAEGSVTAPIPASIGHPGTARFRVNRSVPAGVDPVRFAQLAATAGARWGLRSLGDTTAQPLATDRVNVVGFSAETGSEALGVQRDVVQTIRERATGRVVRERIIDQDLAIAIDVPWQQGPAHPSPDQYDLETVLIHELGHMAGNKEHAAACANTPMVASAAPGEWWRSPEDYFWGGCSRAGFRAGGAPAIRHEVVRITRWIG